MFFSKHVRLNSTIKMNFRENRRGNQKWTIQRNWQPMVHKTQDEGKQNKNTTKCVGHHYTLTNSNNVNKT